MVCFDFFGGSFVSFGFGSYDYFFQFLIVMFMEWVVLVMIFEVVLMLFVFRLVCFCLVI